MFPREAFAEFEIATQMHSQTEMWGPLTVNPANPRTSSEQTADEGGVALITASNFHFEILIISGNIADW